MRWCCNAISFTCIAILYQHACPYPFTPLAVNPWMKYFCAKKKITITGAVISNEPAIIMLMLLPAWTLKA